MLKNYLVFVLVLLPVKLFAQIIVDKTILHFDVKSKPFQNVSVRNLSKEVIFVNVEATEVTAAGLKSEKRIPTKEFLVSPRRFTVEAKGSRTVRVLVARKPGEKMSVFRAKFLPSSKNPKLGITKQVGKSKTQIKILTGSGILAFQLPLERKPSLVWNRSSSGLTFKNHGNVYALLSDVKVCKLLEGPCKDLDGNRIYPGSEWTIRVPRTSFVKFNRDETLGAEAVVIEPS